MINIIYKFIKDTLWKIQLLFMTKLFELFLWIMAAGTITSLMINYLTAQHMNSIYSDIFLFIFVYYTCYKILLD
jgi:hypothetical protein